MSHPVFGKESRRALSTCDNRLVVLAEESIRVGMDFSVLCGYRDKFEQDRYFRLGLSKKPWPASKHNMHPARAMDIAPFPVNWNDAERFYHLIGIIRCRAYELEIPIVCGLDWDNDFDLRDQTFMDLGHIELGE